MIKTVNNDLVIVRLTDPLTPVAAVSQEAGTHYSDYFAIVKATLHYSQVLFPPPIFSYFFLVGNIAHCCMCGALKQLI